MAISPTYPGVYVEEVPSSIRTVTGVATSIAAFIGRARRGPVGEPVSVFGYADFERVFGGLWLGSSLGYAVRDFFLNGGSQALIVRLYARDGEQRSKAVISANDLELEAASEGAWSNTLLARIDHDTPSPTDRLFNLALRDDASGREELHRNLSTDADHPRRVDRVLAQSSQLARAVGALPGDPPAPHASARPGEDVWGDNTPPTCSRVREEASDGSALGRDDFIGDGSASAKRGLFALERADIFNLLCLPPYGADGNVDAQLVAAAAQYCEKRRALLIVDPPTEWTSKEAVKNGLAALGTNSRNAALYFPRLRQPNPLRENQVEEFVPCGAVAGVIARTDAQRGVWKAPAGLEATLVGVPELSVPLTDGENGELNPLGVNCLRALPGAGRIVWGARTLQGDDRLASEWKYLPVRRLALHIEESLYRGFQWVVFEPNDQALWSQIRLNGGAFMQGLFQQGAFQGRTSREAYFVKCDRETTPQDDVNRGIVNIVVGFAPLRPAEFVVLRIQQIAGQVAA